MCLVISSNKEKNAHKNGREADFFCEIGTLNRTWSKVHTTIKHVVKQSCWNQFDAVNQVLFKEFRIINFCGKQHETHYQTWSCFIIFLTMNALTTIILTDSNIEFHVWLKITNSKTPPFIKNRLFNDLL